MYADYIFNIFNIFIVISIKQKDSDIIFGEILGYIGTIVYHDADFIFSAFAEFFPAYVRFGAVGGFFEIKIIIFEPFFVYTSAVQSKGIILSSKFSGSNLV